MAPKVINIFTEKNKYHLNIIIFFFHWIVYIVTIYDYLSLKQTCLSLICIDLVNTDKFVSDVYNQSLASASPHEILYDNIFKLLKMLV